MTAIFGALGATPYAEGLALQEALVRRRAEGATGDWLLYPDHASVLTVGRDPSPGSVLADRDALARAGVELFEVARWRGDVTWHGPGQLVGYPILDLSQHQPDLHWYLRMVEEALIVALSGLGIEGERNPGYTGVWTRGRKIASIGIHVRQWVTTHGFALNVDNDLGDFAMIVPCGIPGVTMTSVTREAGLPPAPDRVRREVADAFGRVFGLEPVTMALPAALAPRNGSVNNNSSSNGVSRPWTEGGGNTSVGDHKRCVQAGRW